MKGTFIVFEGGGGTGKDTLINILKEKLAGREGVVFTREPGGTPLGMKVREIMLSHEMKGIDAKAELLMFLAARAEHIEKIIKPALQEGKTIVSNRFALSSIAYQVYGNNRLDLLPFARAATKEVIGDCIPDLVFFLDTPPEVAIGRARSRPEEAHRFVAEDLEFQKRAYEGYKKHLNDFSKKIVAIDTSGSANDAWTKAEEALQSFF